MVILWLVAFTLLPSVSATKDYQNNNTVHDTHLIHLEPRASIAREVFRLTPLAESLVRSAADVLLAEAKSSGKAFDPEVLGQTLFDTLRNEFLPPSTNIGIDIIEEKPEDAAKDAIKAVAEPLLDLALEGVAPETAGASLLLLSVSNIAVDIAVDELFKGADLLTEFAANATEGHGATQGEGATGGQAASAEGACDSANYVASPWFYRVN
jgi:hypothetical protein